MVIFPLSKPFQESESECGCGELMARRDGSATDLSEIYFTNCNDGEDLRSLNVSDTFELCQADYPERKLYHHTWLVFY